MRYDIQCKEHFNTTIRETEQKEGITLLHVAAEIKGEPEKLSLCVKWQMPSIGIHAIWAPGKYKNKDVVMSWGRPETSFATRWAPVYADVSCDDRNRQTIACSDGKNTVEIRTGVLEPSGSMECVVKISVDYSISYYEADIRIDTRDIPFYKVIDDVRRWWETYEGYMPAKVPETACQPVYSTWYSYHQNLDIPSILEECRYFSRLGCKVIIVDDGWQTANTGLGYAYCGDWRPAPGKIPDMKAFVDAVHETGMKFVLWYSVPYVGEYSEAYTQFQDKILHKAGGAESRTYVVDPRYSKVREYLIGLYRQAVLDWGLDGFKLDFVDTFVQSDVVKPGMDYVSVYDAVDRLLKDVIKTLRELKPDILIEFRQAYMGPLMRTFGNMIRSVDCPGDSWSNGMNVLTLRMTSGATAVHSDMVMWHPEESPELAAFQLTRVLFSVPQISVNCRKMSPAHGEMVRRYLEFWVKYRETLLYGEMLYKGYVYNYPYVSARSEKEQVGAVYAGRIAYIEQLTDEIALVNATLEHEIWIDSRETGKYLCCIYDCCGKEVGRKPVQLQRSVIIDDVPVNGTVILMRMENS